MRDGVIDLRSDTVTVPTDEMRAAMATAVVGDDGYDEDPTVAELERVFAARVGKDAAVLVPSGVMANQIALRIIAPPGSLVAAGAHSHLVLYEMGAAGRNSSIQLTTLDEDRGSLRVGDIAALIEAQSHHQPELGAIAIESPHMASGGHIIDPGVMEALADVAGDRPIHLDGARLFNAEVATGIAADQLAQHATTVMSCLSKGLSAPIGSILAGPSELIAAARVERKRLGGAMRQAGVIAAPGLVALDSMVARLSDDHRRAHEIAQSVAARWPALEDHVLSQPINLVVFEHEDPAALLDHLRAASILAGTIAPGVVRLVTHRGVDDGDVAVVCDAIRTAP